MRRLTLATLTAVLLLAGCSSGDGSDGSGGSDGADAGSGPTAASPSSATASPPDAAAPACGEVWQASRTLPADYTTCLEDGEAVAPDATECTDGSSLIVHRDQFYAITGHKIVEPDEAPLQDTDAFGEAYASCTGE